MIRTTGIIAAGVLALTLAFGTAQGAEQPTASQRQEHEQAAEKKLTDLDRKMHELSAEAKKAGERTRDELNQLYDQFKQKQGSAKGELEELRKSTNETWQKARVRMDKAIEDLNGLYERTRAKLKGSGREETK